MGVFQSDAPEQGRSGSSTGQAAPTPDYGTLGPDSDIENKSGSSSPSPGSRTRALHIVAVLLGAGSALLVSSAAGHGILNKFAGQFTPQNSAVSAKNHNELDDDRELDRQKPQKQAEILLERAVSHSNEGTDRSAAKIDARLESWRGKLKWDSQLGQLTTAALNSDDRGVRESAIEVQLAAYGLNKDESTVRALLRRADSSDHVQKVWALWTLGLMANRGIETERIVQALAAHARYAERNGAAKNGDDEDSRRWAVEGLALVGTTSTIAPLLDAMHNDPSAMVRERAACSVAQSGMLSDEQRLTAVPQLIDYSSDPALDAETRAWAFQALSDITKQRLPRDSAAWRNWYQSSHSEN